MISEVMRGTIFYFGRHHIFEKALKSFPLTTSNIRLLPILFYFDLSFIIITQIVVDMKLREIQRGSAP